MQLLMKCVKQISIPAARTSLRTARFGWQATLFD